MPMTALPTPPSRADSSNFSSRADALFTALPGFVTEANALQVDVTGQQATATAAAATAQAAVASVTPTKWLAATNYAIGTAVWSPIDFQTYRAKTGGVLGVDPATDAPANWIRVTFGTGVGGTTAAAPITLTASSLPAQGILPSFIGAAVTLPSALTLAKGTNAFSIFNRAGWPLPIKNGAGTLLGFVPAFGTAECSLVDNGSVAGIWSIDNLLMLEVDVSGSITLSTATTSISNPQAVALDATRTMLLLTGSASMHAVVYDESTGVFGSPVLVRTANVPGRVGAILCAANAVLVASHNATTAMEAVVLSVAGSVITVNVAATAATANNVNYVSELIALGTAWAMAYNTTLPSCAARAITISGTTVTIGAEVTLPGAAVPQFTPQIWAASATVLLAFTTTASSAIQASSYNLSGSTLTLGNTASGSVCDATALFRTRAFASGGRWMVIYRGSTGLPVASVVNVAGSTVSLTNVTLGSTSALPGYIHVIGNQAIVVSDDGAGSAYINALTDNAGTAVAGTEIIRTITSTNGVGVFGSSATELWLYIVGGSTQAWQLNLGLSGNNVVINAAYPTYVASAAVDLPASASTLKAAPVAKFRLPHVNGSYGVVQSPSTNAWLQACRIQPFQLTSFGKKPITIPSPHSGMIAGQNNTFRHTDAAIWTVAVNGATNGYTIERVTAA